MPKEEEKYTFIHQVSASKILILCILCIAGLISYLVRLVTIEPRGNVGSAEYNNSCTHGRILYFKLGARLKKSRRAEGGAKIVGVFRVKNHDFTQRNHIFFSILGRVRPAPWIRPWY